MHYDPSWDLEEDKSLGAKISQFMDATAKEKDEYTYVDIRRFPQEIYAAYYWIRDNCTFRAVSSSGREYRRNPSLGEIVRAAVPVGLDWIESHYKGSRIDYRSMVRKGFFTFSRGSSYEFTSCLALVPGSVRWQVPVSSKSRARAEDVRIQMNATMSTVVTAALIAAIASDEDECLFAGSGWPWQRRAEEAMNRWFQHVEIMVESMNLYAKVAEPIHSD